MTFKYKTDLISYKLEPFELEAIKKNIKTLTNIEGEFIGSVFCHNKKLSARDLGSIRGFIIALSYTNYGLNKELSK